MNLKIESLDWQKGNGLIPVVVQDFATHQVLMVGYMNQQALAETVVSKKVTFYSRSKKRLWVKGETSGNDLSLISISADCDKDTLLARVKPTGVTCHLNNPSCFEQTGLPTFSVFSKLEEMIEDRYSNPAQDSYITQLFNEGDKRIAQKVGEEGVEVALACVSGSKTEVVNEAADLIFHLLVLLKACQVSLAEVIAELDRRSKVGE